jgi:hypothetical protein
MERIKAKEIKTEIINNLDNQSRCSAGQYFVCAELSRRGAIASLTLGNTQGVDILATSYDGHNSALIQVKTTKESTWIMGVKDENRFHPANAFYIFVRFRTTNDMPEYYIVLAGVVANRLSEEFKEWAKTPGRGGRPHDSKSSIRIWHESKDSGHKDKWGILGLF